MATQAVRKSTTIAPMGSTSSSTNGICDKSSIKELKSFANPPEDCLTTVIGVLQLLGHGKKIGWKDCQKAMANP